MLNKKEYFKLETEDWRDTRHFYGTHKEFAEYQRTGHYNMASNQSGTRCADGYLASNVILEAPPQEGEENKMKTFVVEIERGCRDRNDSNNIFDGIGVSKLKIFAISSVGLGNPRNIVGHFPDSWRTIGAFHGYGQWRHKITLESIAIGDTIEIVAPEYIEDRLGGGGIFTSSGTYAKVSVIKKNEIFFEILEPVYRERKQYPNYGKRRKK